MTTDQVEEETPSLEVLIIAVDHRPEGLVTYFESLVYCPLLPVNAIRRVTSLIEVRHELLDVLGVDIGRIYIADTAKLTIVVGADKPPLRLN